MKNIFYDYDNRKKTTPIYKVEASEKLNEYMHSKKIAVQIHAFFLDVLDELIEQINYIPFAFDVFISTDTVEKKDEIISKYTKKIRANKVVVEQFENRGRDVLPFLIQMSSTIEQYDFICHLHTKKSETIDWGDAWRHHLCNNLFGSEAYVKEIFNKFYQNVSLGLVIQEVYPVLQLAADWGQTKSDVEMLLKDMNLDVELPEHPIFSAGTMFWARVDAVLPLFKLSWEKYDFPDEDGQINFTLAHAIERIWVYLVKGSGYDYDIYHNEIAIASNQRKSRLAIFALTDTTFLNLDHYLIEDLREVVDDLVVIGNTQEVDIVSQSKEPLAMLQEVLRLNINDFAKYDEIVLVSNELFGANKELSSMISYYDKHEYNVSCMYARKDIQGNVEKLILNSNFLIIDTYDSTLELIRNLQISNNRLEDEAKLSEILSLNNKTSHVYVIESIYMGEILHNNESLETLPYEYTILNAPCLLKNTLVQLTNDSFEATISYFNQLPKGKRFVKYFQFIENVEKNEPKRSIVRRVTSLILRKLCSIKRRFIN